MTKSKAVVVGIVNRDEDLEPKFVAATLERLAMMGLSTRLAEDADGERVV